MADRVAVMYAGKIVEIANVKDLFATPRHPYTQGLIASIPILGVIEDRLAVIPGAVPNLINLPSGCTFADRCSAREEHGLDICTQKMPELTSSHGANHKVRCWLYSDDIESSHTAVIK